jgi:alkaline phosphatase D
MPWGEFWAVCPERPHRIAANSVQKQEEIMKTDHGIARIITLAVALIAGALAPARVFASGALFTHGIASGEVTPRRALLWTRVDRPAVVRAEISQDPAFSTGVRRKQTLASPADDYTVKIVIGRLAPASIYYYRFVSEDSISETGTFRTPPTEEEASDVRFGWASDLDGSPVPPINNFESLDRAREADLDFFIYNGDNIYADNPPACGADLECLRGKYKQDRDYPALRSLFSSAASYVIWDDHELTDNWAGETVDPSLFSSGRQAFEEYMPLRNSLPEAGFYRSFGWGKEAQLIILDERTFRSAEADVACEGDLLPTLPPEIRVEAGLPPEPSAGCLEAINDPGRTMLGPRQKEWLKANLLESEATWKLIVNEVAIAELFGLPYDRWEGYAAERSEILEFIRDNGIQNVVFLTGDLHANVVSDVRPGIFSDPTPLAKEIISGPVAERTLYEELVGLLGSDDSALAFIGLVTALTSPDCFEPNSYTVGLADIDAATHRLTARIVDGTGAIVCSTVLEAQ